MSSSMVGGGIAVWLGVLFCLGLATAAPSRLPRLKVSANARYLVTEEGKPFFWLGDTAWWIRRLTPAEVDEYLTTRARQGFNLIQIAPASTYTRTDYAGRQAFVNGNPDTPDEAFWRNIDEVVAKAARHGLYVVLFPVWASDLNGLVGEDTAKARRLGLWLGRRYCSSGHVLWAVTGEYDSINGFSLPIREEQKAVLRALAEGLQEGHGNTQLMTIHPGVARTSSLDFHGDAWLDLNMLQTGHQIDAEGHGLAESYALVAHDYALAPTKPVVDGEPMYEDTPDAVWMVQNTDGPRGGAEVMRQKAYWSVFAGACGHTYGHNDVFGFNVPVHPGNIIPYPQGPGQRGHWRDALSAPGATQMRHLRALMESRPMLTRLPDQALIVGDAGKGVARIQATRDAEGSYAMVYLPGAGQSVTVDTSHLSAARLKVWWYDPRTGKATAEKGEPQGGEKITFRAPGTGPDWVLVLDDAARGYPPPGRGTRAAD